MTFGQAVKTVLTTKYADFSGRATRGEYWWYQLFVFACLIVVFIPVVVAIATTPTDQDPTGASLALLIGAFVVGAAFFLATVVTILNPVYMAPLYHTATGQKLLATGIVMLTIGSLMLKKIASFRG